MPANMCAVVSLKNMRHWKWHGTNCFGSSNNYNRISIVSCGRKPMLPEFLLTETTVREAGTGAEVALGHCDALFENVYLYHDELLGTLHSRDRRFESIRSLRPRMRPSMPGAPDPERQLLRQCPYGPDVGRARPVLDCRLPHLFAFVLSQLCQHFWGARPVHGHYPSYVISPAPSQLCQHFWGGRRLGPG